MKKLLKAALIAALALGIAACGPKKNQTGQLIELTAQDTIDKFKAGDTFIFFVGQTTCSHCEIYIAALKKFMETNPLTVYYVEADADANVDTFDTLMKDYIPDVESTPTSYYVVAGAVQDKVVGEMDEDGIRTWLIRLGLDLPNA